MLGNENLVSPAITWAVATDFAYLDGKWFRMLLEVEGSASSFASDAAAAALRELIRIPTMYTQPPRGFKANEVTFCMAIMSQAALRMLVKGSGSGESFQQFKRLVSRIMAIELGTAVRPFDASEPRVLQELVVDTPNTAIVAVIDDGLAFAHERFRKMAGGKLATRFKYFWNQDDTTAAALPPGFGYGRELTAADIDSSLAAHSWSGIVDEDLVYSELGQKLASRRLKHGTHVMDIACGLDLQEVQSNSPYLIGVQLPSWVTREPSGGLLTPAALDALHFILNRADQIASDESTASLPVVVNLSYGVIAGPHDGSTLLERAIDQLIATRPTALRVVFPAGNYYLSRCHASFGLAAGASRSLRWRVQPDDKAESRVDIWLPELAPSPQQRPKLAVRLTSPAGEVTPWVAPGGVFPPPTLGQSLYQVEYDDTGIGRPQISIYVAPTAEAKSSPRIAQCGTWLIELKNTGSAVSVEAWVQRGDTPFGYPLAGRQSRFDDADYVRFRPSGHIEEEDIGPGPIRRRGTVNALATGQQTIVVGGHRASDQTPSKYSGAGPVATPPIVLPRTGPDVSAAADDSVVMHGILAAGTRSGSVVAMDGTSVAAPQVTRLIAEWMVQGMPSDRYAVQSFAAAKDPNAPAPGTKLQERLGAGRIDGKRPVALR